MSNITRAIAEKIHTEAKMINAVKKACQQENGEHWWYDVDLNKFSNSVDEAECGYIYLGRCCDKKIIMTAFQINGSMMNHKQSNKLDYFLVLSNMKDMGGNSRFWFYDQQFNSLYTKPEFFQDCIPLGVVEDLKIMNFALMCNSHIDIK